MPTIIYNPPKKRRRGGRRKKMTKAAIGRRRRAAARKGARTRARRKCAGTVRSAVQTLACGPMKRIRRIRRSCPVSAARCSKSRKRRGHGGIRGILSAGRAPYAVVRNRSPRRRRRRRNSGIMAWTPSMRGPAQNPAGLSFHAIKGVLPVVGGMIANEVAGRWVSSRYPQFGSGYMGVAAGLGTAGLLSGVAGMVAPRASYAVLAGASAQAVAKLLQMLMPSAAPQAAAEAQAAAPAAQAVEADAGMSDFLVQRQVNDARLLS